MSRGRFGTKTIVVWVKNDGNIIRDLWILLKCYNITVTS